MATIPDLHFAANRLLDNGGAVVNALHPKYGVVGDGVTDDGAALNAMMLTLPVGTVVVLPAYRAVGLVASYATSVTITVPSGITLTGQDQEVTITVISGNNPLQIVTLGTNNGGKLSALSNVTLDGSRATESAGVSTQGGARDGVDMARLNSRLNGVVIKNCQQYGVVNSAAGAGVFADVYDCIISNCGSNFYGTGYGIKLAQVVSGNQVIGNRITSCYNFDQTSGCAINLETSLARCTANYIASQTTNDFGGAIRVFSGNTNQGAVTVTGNIINLSGATKKNCGISVYGRGVTVTGNAIQGTAAGYGISINPSGANMGQDIAITGNSVNGALYGVMVADTGTSGYPKYFAITGNTVSNCTKGIYIEPVASGDVDYFTIVGNNLADTNTAAITDNSTTTNKMIAANLPGTVNTSIPFTGILPVANGGTSKGTYNDAYIYLHGFTANSTGDGLELATADYYGNPVKVAGNPSTTVKYLQAVGNGTNPLTMDWAQILLAHLGIVSGTGSITVGNSGTYVTATGAGSSSVGWAMSTTGASVCAVKAFYYSSANTFECDITPVADMTVGFVWWVKV